jgi:hypothetical protein
MVLYSGAESVIGNSVKIGGGSAAVIPPGNAGNVLGIMPLFQINETGRSSRMRESQKTCLNTHSGHSFGK